MNVLTNVDLLTVGIAVAGNLVLGMVVFLENKRSATSIFFLLLTLSLSFWSVANYFSYKVSDHLAALWLVRLVMFFAALIGGLFILFVDAFPHEKLRMSKKYAYFIIFFTAVSMLLALSPFLFSNIILNLGAPPKPVVGPGIVSFIIIPIFAIVIGILSLVKRTHQTVALEKKQHELLLVGLALMFGLIILLNFILPAFFGYTKFITLSATFTLPFVIFTTYAIIKHRLLNTKIITTEILAFVLSVVTLLEVLLSDNVSVIIFRTIIFSLVLIFGLFLVNSVKKEIQQRECLELITAELQTANTRLKELDQQKTDFLSIAAHQLRTPMSIMNGYIELIKDNAYGKVTSETKTILGNMDQSNQHLIKLVDEFLDITRIEQGRTKFDFANHDVSPIIDGIVGELSVRAKERGLKLSWERLKQPLIANMDEEKIRHVIYNFLDNAIKYSESGTIVITAQEVLSEPSTVPSFYSSAPSSAENSDKPGIIVRVKDHGVGFGKLDEASFFQKFYRGSNVKHINVNGTGLGLFVCRKFIENHGGHIWAHSAGLGRGSEFGFWIPIKQN